jgi:hypothetical protein
LGHPFGDRREMGVEAGQKGKNMFLGHNTFCLNNSTFFYAKTPNR